MRHGVGLFFDFDFIKLCVACFHFEQCNLSASLLCFAFEF